MFDTIAQNYGVNAPQAMQGGLNWQKAALTDPMQQQALYGMFGGPQYWASQGYTGSGPSMPQYDSNTGAAIPGGTDWADFLKSKGYGYNFANDESGFRHGQLTQNGQTVAGVPDAQWAEPDNTGFNITRAGVLAGLAYGGAAAAGMGSGGAAAGAGDVGGDLAVDGAVGSGGAAASASPYTYMGPGSLGAGSGADVAIGSDGLAYAGGAGGVGSAGAGGGAAGGSSSSPGFWNSLSNGQWGDAASAAGDWATSPTGLKTIGGLGSALIGSKAAGNALDAQTNATNQANALAKYMYDTNRSDWAPYRDLGKAGTTGYANLLQNPGSITQDPGYQFGLTQGQTAIDRSAASKGGLYSGATLKALQRYGQDYGSTKLDNSLGRFANAAQLGATGTSGTQASGTNYTNQVGQNTTGLGNAAAGNSLLQGNIWQNALNGAVSAYGQPKP